MVLNATFNNISVISRRRTDKYVDIYFSMHKTNNNKNKGHKIKNGP
jgi:hypothetical protein